MGTDDAQVTVTAATLAGGDKNQDRYAYGDGWAFVLDGASSFVKTRPEHDGGWYADHLKQELSAGLTVHSQRATPEIVEDAIRTVAGLHGDDADSCPTSTIALARWDTETVEVYLLGDSAAVLISVNDNEEVLADPRLAEVAPAIRGAYRSRIAAGHGFDERHRELLQSLQAKQAQVRNRADGYWIAGADPDAAHHGLTARRPLNEIECVILASDGAAAGLRYGAFQSWSMLAKQPLDLALQTVHMMEGQDGGGAKWPRSKPHDDKTVVCVRPS